MPNYIVELPEPVDFSKTFSGKLTQVHVAAMSPAYASALAFEILKPFNPDWEAMTAKEQGDFLESFAVVDVTDDPNGLNSSLVTAWAEVDLMKERLSYWKQWTGILAVSTVAFFLLCFFAYWGAMTAFDSAEDCHKSFESYMDSHPVWDGDLNQPINKDTNNNGR